MVMHTFLLAVRVRVVYEVKQLHIKQLFFITRSVILPFRPLHLSNNEQFQGRTFPVKLKLNHPGNQRRTDFKAISLPHLPTL